MSSTGETRMARHRVYEDRLDLTGKNLISLLDHPKADLAPFVAALAPAGWMEVVELPILEGETSATTGEVADEIHEWPHARLGTTFRHLRLSFLRGRLLTIHWRFPSLMRKIDRRPWYRR